MQYDNKYDLNHNDCPEYETEFPGEFAPDILIETGTDQCDEFETPEYDEQAATTDLSDLYEDKDSDNITAPYHDGCNCSSEEENGYNGDAVNYNSESAADNYEKSNENVNPYDETAATFDECYCNDRCNCGSAHEKCKLDDY